MNGEDDKVGDVVIYDVPNRSQLRRLRGGRCKEGGSQATTQPFLSQRNYAGIV